MATVSFHSSSDAIVLPLLLVLLASCPAWSGLSSASHNLLESKLKHYDRRIRPEHRGPPVMVGVNMHFMEVRTINEAAREFSATFLFRQSWRDPRLVGAHVPQWDERTSRDSDVVEKLWIPDTFFVDDKHDVVHTTTLPNAFSKIDTDGTVMRNARVTTTSPCNIDLTYYPMDTQTCTIELESYGNPSSEVVYYWSSEPVTIDGGISTLPFYLVGSRCRADMVEVGTANYSRLSVDLFFQRSMCSYVLFLYIPVTLLVAISFLPFWIGRTSHQARATVAVTTVLSLALLLIGSSDSLPHHSYIRAIDVYTGVSFLLVVGAMAEYAFVEFGRRNYKELLPGVTPIKPKRKGGFCSDLDECSKMVFPISYGSFILIYWIVYLDFAAVQDEDLVYFESEGTSWI